MAMSRKHYREAAEVIKNVVTEAELQTPARKKAATEAAREIARGLANMFRADNGLFDRAKFMDACGLGDPNGN